MAKATAEKEEVVNRFQLPNKRVTIKPIIKPTMMIPDVNHRASFLAPGAKYRVPLPLLKNGTLKNPLTNEEKEFFENEEWGLGYGKNYLSVLKKDDNFWQNFELYLEKQNLTLELSNPEDYLKYKLLCACDDIVAKNHRDLRDKARATYKFYMEFEEDIIADKSEKADVMAQAWEEFFKVREDRAKMFDILTVYGRRPSNDVSDKFLASEISEQLQKGKAFAKEFIMICQDPDFDLKVNLRNGMKVGAILKRNGQFLTTDGEFLGRTEEQVVKFLKEPINQELLLKIESRLS